MCCCINFSGQMFIGNIFDSCRYCSDNSCEGHLLMLLFSPIWCPIVTHCYSCSSCIWLMLFPKSIRNNILFPYLERNYKFPIEQPWWYSCYIAPDYSHELGSPYRAVRQYDSYLCCKWDVDKWEVEYEEWFEQKKKKDKEAETIRKEEEAKRKEEENKKIEEIEKKQIEGIKKIQNNYKFEQSWECTSCATLNNSITLYCTVCDISLHDSLEMLIKQPENNNNSKTYDKEARPDITMSKKLYSILVEDKKWEILHKCQSLYNPQDSIYRDSHYKTQFNFIAKIAAKMAIKRFDIKMPLHCFKKDSFRDDSLYKRDILCKEMNTLYVIKQAQHKYRRAEFEENIINDVIREEWKQCKKKEKGSLISYKEFCSNFNLNFCLDVVGNVIILPRGNSPSPPTK